eukprot:scaffold4540_cov66-Cyclotella_meneghiniana.AAC.5
MELSPFLSGETDLIVSVDFSAVGWLTKRTIGKPYSATCSLVDGYEEVRMRMSGSISWQALGSGTSFLQPPRLLGVAIHDKYRKGYGIA